MDSWPIELKPAPLCPDPASPPPPRLHSLPRSPPRQHPAKSSFLFKGDDPDDPDDPDDHDYHDYHDYRDDIDCMKESHKG